MWHVLFVGTTEAFGRGVFGHREISVKGPITTVEGNVVTIEVDVLQHITLRSWEKHFDMMVVTRRTKHRFQRGHSKLLLLVFERGAADIAFEYTL